MAATTLPTEFSSPRLRRRIAQVVLLLVVLGVVVALAPGLGEVREAFEGIDPWWVGVAVALEALSGVSYVALFRPVFCRRLSWRSSWEISWSELGAGSLVPASGASGLALGAWVLHRGGMSAGRIARRSVAFFLIKSSVNFVAVAVVGFAAFLGLGPELSPLLTVLPASLSVLLVGAVLLVPRLGPGREPAAGDGRVRRAVLVARRSLVGGVGEAVAIVRSGNLLVIGGAIGYWAFDNAVLWATFRALGESVPLTVLLLGYLIGQLGGLLPIPGGVGGIDGGLIGTLVVYGAPAAPAAAAVLVYRIVLFWLPLVLGGLAFASLRRGLAGPRPLQADLCG